MMGKFSILLGPIGEIDDVLLVNPIAGPLTSEYSDENCTEFTRKHLEARDCIREYLAENVSDDFPMDMDPLFVDISDTMTALYIPMDIIEEDVATTYDYTALLEMFLYAFDMAVFHKVDHITIPLEFGQSEKYNTALLVTIAHTCAMMYLNEFEEICLQTTNSNIIHHLGMKIITH